MFERASRQPGESALTDPSGQLTWRDAADRVTSLAAALRRLDFPDGSRLAVVGHNCSDTVLAYASAARAGIGAIRVNHHQTAGEIEHLLRDGRARAVWASSELLAIAADAAARCGIPMVAAGMNSRHWRSLVPGEAWLPPPSDLPAATNLIYTSATTGTAKGIEVPHAPVNTVSEGLAAMRQHHLAGLGPHLAVGPLYHAGPHAAVGLLLTGTPLVVAGRFDAARIIDAIEHHRIATSVMVPTHFVRLLALPEKRRRESDVSSIRRIALTGSSCPIQVYKAMLDWFGPVFREAYGASESGTVSFITSQEWITHQGSVGRSQPPFRFLILDAEGAPCPPGRQGTIYIVDDTGRGIRYYNDPAKTAAAHRAPGTFTLGDVGYLDEEGYLYVTGRVTDMVISGGVNIYPAECQRVLTSHPSVRNAALFGVPDDEMGERLVGIVSLQPDGTTPEDLLAFCQDKIARYKVPKELLAVAEIPTTPMGKLDKRALRQAYLDGSFGSARRHGGGGAAT